MGVVGSNFVATANPSEKRWKWFADAIRDDRDGKPVQALGHMFREVDKLFTSGKFAEVDEWLSSLSPAKLSVNLIVGVLSITKPASDRLSRRQTFLDDAWAVVEGRGRSAAKLLGGLKGHKASDGETAQVSETR